MIKPLLKFFSDVFLIASGISFLLCIDCISTPSIQFKICLGGILLCGSIGLILKKLSC